MCAILGKEYILDWLLAASTFFIVSGQHVFTAYIISFERATLGPSVASKNGSGLLSTLWTATIVGRLVSIAYQLRGYTNRLLIDGTFILSALAFLASLFLYPSLYMPGSGFGVGGVWVAAIFFGLAFGPVLGYLFDLQHRISDTHEAGLAIVIFGLNVGTGGSWW